MRGGIGDHSSVRLLILAGGLGTRIRPAIGATPKSMAPVGGRPFLEYLLDLAVREGFTRVTLLTGYGATAIHSHFGTGTEHGVEIMYSHESEPLGTGGALRLAAGRFHDERFLVMNGDSFVDIQLHALLDAHLGYRAIATLALAEVSNADRFGAVEVDSQGQVSRFVEKGETTSAALVNAGVYVVERSVLEGIEPGRAVSLEHEVFPMLIGRGLYAVPFSAPLVDIGVPFDLEALRARPEALNLARRDGPE